MHATQDKETRVPWEGRAKEHIIFIFRSVFVYLSFYKISDDTMTKAIMIIIPWDVQAIVPSLRFQDKKKEIKTKGKVIPGSYPFMQCYTFDVHNIAFSFELKLEFGLVWQNTWSGPKKNFQLTILTSYWIYH